MDCLRNRCLRISNCMSSKRSAIDHDFVSVVPCNFKRSKSSRMDCFSSASSSGERDGIAPGDAFTMGGGGRVDENDAGIDVYLGSTLCDMLPRFAMQSLKCDLVGRDPCLA